MAPKTRTLEIFAEEAWVDRFDQMAKTLKKTRAEVLDIAVGLLSHSLNKAEEGMVISFTPAEEIKAIVTNDDAFAKVIMELSSLTQRSNAEVLRDAVNLYYESVKEYKEGKGILFVPMQSAPLNCTPQPAV